MPNVNFGAQSFAADLVIFDKDGTLIDFAHLWAAKTVAAVEALVHRTDADPALRRDLYATLGYDPDAGRFAAQSPVLTAPVSTMRAVAATVLYQHGRGWLDAELLVEAHFAPALDGVFRPDMIRPTADLPALFAGLHAAGVKLAVVTSDDRAPTATTLAWLGVDRYVGFLAGADDPYPVKPAPDAVWAACRTLDADPAHTAVVGDSTTDLEMARRAGVGLRVAVCTGLMTAAMLAPYADIVLESVAAIRG